MTPRPLLASLLVACALVITANPVPAFARPLSGTPAASHTEPVITSVRGRNVSVAVPAGFDRVILQSLRTGRRRAAADDKADRWKTIGTKYPHREENVVTFRLPRLTPKRQLRVLGNQDDILPGSFFTGFTNFLGDPPIADSALSPGVPGAIGDGALGANGIAASGKATDFADTRSVVEADIWKLVGDRLYFYNQLRGLQLFDLSDPKEPALLGTLRMPAAGEDLYVLATGEAVLLKRGSYALWDPWFWGGPIMFFGAAPGEMSLTLRAADLRVSNAALFYPWPQQTTTSEVIVADVSAGKPAIVARVPLDGSIRESRMVGEILYVAADVNDSVVNGFAPTWGCRITSFDLHDPAHPVKRDSIDLDGWPTAVSATDQFFFVARWDSAGVNNAAGNVVEVLDISAPDGTMKRRGAVKVKGNITDKFKLHQEGSTFTAISASWRYETSTGEPLEEWGPDARWVPFTTIETFSLENADAPVALGTLEIAAGETVRATRFDEGRVYVVTFVQIDPLWIVDLRKPAQLKVLGHVEAPGFSTYIEPLGDRLVTIGLVRGRPAVSLFDVADPAHPALLKQVVISSDAAGNDWTWSEAVWDEKAFRVLPDEKLILLPLSSYSYPSGSAGRVQLIDLLRNDLVKRGVIEAEFFPRRATVHRESIVSIAPTKLVTVDATDRDHPVVQSEIEIAWSTSRLFVVGEHLIEIGDVDIAGGTPRLTITPADDPEATLRIQELPVKGSVVGATVHDDVLYIAQMDNESPVYDDGTKRATRVLSLCTFDVSQLPAVNTLGATSIPVNVTYGWGWSLPELEPLWPGPTTLVWSTEGEVKGWRRAVWFNAPALKSDVTGAADANVTAVSNVIAIDRWIPYWAYSRSRVLHAFDVTLPSRPKHASTIEVGKGEPWDVSRAFAADGTVYLSHKQLGKPVSSNATDLSGETAGDAEPQNEDGKNANRHFLDVVGYEDPSQPDLGDTRPNLPGRLVGLSRHGRLLYTMGLRYDLATGAAVEESAPALHASAFDGSAVHLLDNLPLAAEGQPFAVAGETLFLLKPEPTHIWKSDPDDFGYVENPALTKLSTFKITDEGKFSKLDEIALSHESNLSLFGNLAVAHGGPSYRICFLAWNAGDYWSGGNSRHLQFIDVTNPTDLRALGGHTFEGAIYPNLSFADGDIARGVWVPLGDYGVEFVPLPSE